MRSYDAREARGYERLRRVLVVGQSYHNVPKALITFAEQNHNSKLKRRFNLQKPRRPYNQAKRDDELVRQRASVDCSANVLQRAKQVRSTALQKAKFAKSIYFLPFLWYNTTNR